MKLIGSLARLAVLVIAGVFSGTLWILSALINGTVGLIGSNRQKKKRSGSAIARARRTANNAKRDPPKAAEFRTAGIDFRSCGRCRQSIKKMNYVFMLEGVPTVYCPSCWSKATSPMQSQEKLDAWWARLTSLYERRTAVLR